MDIKMKIDPKATKTYQVRIESGAICELFTVKAQSEGHAANDAWNLFEPMVSAARFENAQITDIKAV